MRIIQHHGWLVAALACLVGGVGVTGDRGGSEKHRGMSYAHEWRRAEDLGYGSAKSHASLVRLKEIGVSWISISPFGFQSAPHDTTIRWGGARFSESDDRLRRVTAQAHELGIKVMLKPHLWLRPPAWVGVIDHEHERDRVAWFEAYRAFALHYATLAAQAGMDAFCIGNELEKTTRHEAAWRSLIRDARAIYRGPITYGAGGYEAQEIKFWDALEYIGISAYYPLVNAASPDRRALVARGGRSRKTSASSQRAGRDRSCSPSWAIAAPTSPPGSSGKSGARRGSISNCRPTHTPRSSKRYGPSAGSPASIGGSGCRTWTMGARMTTTTRRGRRRLRTSSRTTTPGNRFGNGCESVGSTSIRC